jgi:hypothetical protein
MGRKFPFGDIQTDDMFPAMNGIFKALEFEEWDGPSGKLTYHIKFACVSPADFKGMRYDEWYCVGDDEHPDEIVKTTLGCKNLELFRVASGIPPEMNDDEELAEFIAATNPHVGLKLYVTEREKDGQKIPTNSISRQGYFQLGSKDVEIGIVENTVKKSKSRAALAKRPGFQPGPARKPAMTTPMGPAFAPTTEESKEEEPKEEEMLDCSICGAKVPESEMVEHYKACSSDHDTPSEKLPF